MREQGKRRRGLRRSFECSLLSQSLKAQHVKRDGMIYQSITRADAQPGFLALVWFPLEQEGCMFLFRADQRHSIYEGFKRDRSWYRVDIAFIGSLVLGIISPSAKCEESHLLLY